MGDEFKRCIERYRKENDQTEMQYIKNGSTFWNSGYLDYTDESVGTTAEVQQKPKRNRTEEMARQREEFIRLVGEQG